MENDIKDESSINDKSSNGDNSCRVIKNNDFSDFSAKRDENFNNDFDQNSAEISSNISDSNNSNNSNNTNENNIRFITVNNPLLELYRSNNAIIKIAYYDYCCCCNESNNLYQVFTKYNSNNNTVKHLFQGKEYISCQDYSCGNYIKNPFTLGVNIIVKIIPELEVKPFAIMEKRFSCSCFCLGRPEIVIKASNNNKILGQIQIPFSMGDTTYKLYNSKDKLKYIIDGDYCQLGIICMKNLCCCLPEAFFEIYEPKNNGEKQIVGTIHRIPGKYEKFYHVLDCYEILFPINASGEERFLLICVVFMIEYQIFRKKFGSLECCCCDCMNSDDPAGTCCNECMRFTCGRCCLEMFRL